jgi:hypothetical protein
MIPARRPIAMAVSLALLALTACQRQPDEPPELREEIERGPLRMTVTASPPEVTVGDDVRVAIEFSAPDAYVVRLPDADAFGDLAARLDDDPPAVPGAEGRIWRRSFVIPALASGPLEIPPLVAAYAERSDDDAGPEFESELATSGLTVGVQSVLTDADDPAAPRDITGTLLPARPPWPWWVWGLIIAGSVAAIGGVVLLVRWLIARANRPAPPIAPEVWALRELRALEHADWDDPARVRANYYRMTEIVRAYIERKFALPASEMTTEEFLATLAHQRSALPHDADRLGAFLAACDLVKYAAQQPARDDAQAALDTARAFVDATAAAADRATQGSEAAA